MITRYTRYSNLTDEELFAILDDHYAKETIVNELIIELRQRLEKTTDDFIHFQEYNVQCPLLIFTKSFFCQNYLSHSP